MGLGLMETNLLEFPLFMPELRVQFFFCPNGLTCVRLKVMRECKACLARASNTGKASLALPTKLKLPPILRVYHLQSHPFNMELPNWLCLRSRLVYIILDI